MSNSSDENKVAYIFYAIAIYIYFYYQMNILPSMKLFDFAIYKITLIFEGDFNLNGFVFLLLICLFAFFQYKASLKFFDGDLMNRLKPWDPFFWPIFAGTLIFCYKFFFGFFSIDFSFYSGSSEHWFVLVVAIIFFLVEMLWVFSLAAISAVMSAVYFSLIVHFPVASLFTGLFASMAHYFINGKIDLIKMYLNFLDSFVLADFISFGDNYVIAVLSFITSLLASIYRVSESYGLLEGVL